MAFRVSRREFVDSLALSAAGIAIGTTAKSYARILGSNDRLNFAVIGLNSRGHAHLSSLKANKSSARISYVCDVDSEILKKFADATQKEMGEAGSAKRTSARYLSKKTLTQSRLPAPIIGTRLWL